MPLIVAFTYLLIIYIIIQILFFDTISRAIGLIDLISVEQVEKKQEVLIDTESKKMISYPGYGEQYGKIKIETLGIDLPLYYGDTLSILKNGVRTF